MEAIRTFFARTWAFIVGDQLKAEGLAGFPEVDRPAILDRVADKEGLKILLESAERSAGKADEALKSIQDKAASLATLLVAVLPVAFAGTAFVIAVYGKDENPLLLVAVAAFLIGDGFMVLGAIIAAVTTGLAYSGWVNIDRLDETKPHNELVNNLRAGIADAWYFATMNAAESGRRKGRDLFAARRATAAAFVAYLVAFVLIALASGGDISILG